MMTSTTGGRHIYRSWDTGKKVLCKQPNLSGLPQAMVIVTSCGVDEIFRSHKEGTPISWNVVRGIER